MHQFFRIANLWIALSPVFAFHFVANANGTAKKQLPEQKINAEATAPLPGAGLSSETRNVLKTVSERYLKFRKWSAEFTQENHSIGLGQGQFFKGAFVFEFPNRFKYSLYSPEVVDYISDGKKFWQIQFRQGREKAAHVRVFPDLKKVELDKYLFLLRGIDTRDKKSEARLLKDFAVEGKIIEDELHVILEPRQSNEIVKMTLIFKQSAEALYRAILEDALGAKTIITLLSHKVLKKVPADSFKAVYPSNSKVESIQ